MKRAIVTTTINPPTAALRKFLNIAIQDDWHLFIVGDQKTPHDEYKKFIGDYADLVTYLHPDDQEAISKELSDLIGWNCIQRRNFGLIAAWRWGAEVIATVDDDNIPMSSWGKNVKVGEEFGVSTFKTESRVFDPLSATHPHLWHRGFPVQLLDERTLSKPQLLKRKVLVQADMWDGSPDVDAICRITLDPQVTFNPQMIHFAGNVPGPFNSQNTFLHRDCFPHYFLFPHIGRMDDIWAAYFLQAIKPDSVCYYKATVFQDRNPHDLVKDLDAELIGYHHSLDFADWCANYSEGVKWPDYFPAETLQAFRVYAGLFK